MSLAGILAIDNACIWPPEAMATRCSIQGSLLSMMPLAFPQSEVPTQLSLNCLLSAVRGLSSNAEPGALSGILYFRQASKRPEADELTKRPSGQKAPDLRLCIVVNLEI